ncbi:hypothetical protein ADUPG1_012840 [Aduncisulcus paluster]|uniref:Cilia- and flagella-associated protein 251 n=1 Tax=Aduncisulcus paluster TaxID=2918883 RepID=A0ABQ5K5N1_9EUKA|nr:hypothetical protein ADUPG1_012840 [Aduncisulcus paluster]
MSKPLNLNYVCGINSHLVDGIHSLSDSTKEVIVYATSHIVVVYNATTEQQHMLQGHCNEITSLVVSPDKKWIISADDGEEGLIIVWDAQTYAPIRTIFNPHAHGVAALDISANSALIVSLGNLLPKKERKRGSTSKATQELCIWSWTDSADVPIARVQLARIPDEQFLVKMNPLDSGDIMTVGPSRVVFYLWDETNRDVDTSISYYAPGFSGKDMLRKVETFTHGSFTPSNEAVVATINGELLLYTHTLFRSGVEAEEGRRSPAKLTKLLADGAILYVTQLHGQYIVTGGSDGSVRVYDSGLRILAWYENLRGGGVRGIGFDAMRIASDLDTARSGTANSATSTPRVAAQSRSAVTPRTPHKGQRKPAHSSSPDYNTLTDFFVLTDGCLVIRLASSCHEETDPEQRRGKLYVRGISGVVTCSTTADRCVRRPYVYIGTNKGEVHVFNCDMGFISCARQMEKSNSYATSESSTTKYGAITVIAAQPPYGDVICVGTQSGTIIFLKLNAYPVASSGEWKEHLEEIMVVKRPHSPISRITFSPCGTVCAVADSVNVYIFRFEQTSSGKKWSYKGEKQPHGGMKICDIIIKRYTEDGKVDLRLLSVGEDRNLCVISLGSEIVEDTTSGKPTTSSSVSNGSIKPSVGSSASTMTILSHTPCCVTSTPTCLLSLPPPPNAIRDCPRPGIKPTKHSEGTDPTGSAKSLASSSSQQHEFNISIPWVEFETDLDGKRFVVPGTHSLPIDQESLVLVGDDSYKMRLFGCSPASRPALTFEEETEKLEAMAKRVTSVEGVGAHLLDMGSTASRAEPYPLLRTIIAPSYGLPTSSMKFIHLSGEGSGTGSGESWDEEEEMDGEEGFGDGFDEGHEFGRKAPHHTIVEGNIRHEWQYIAYSTPEKVIGLIRTPLDGLQHRTLGIVAHCGEISSLSVCKSDLDGSVFVVSSGKKDACVNLWKVNVEAFNKSIALNSVDVFGGRELNPFVQMLDEAGESGEYYQRVREFFRYTQTLQEPLDGKHRVKGEVSCCSLRKLCSVLGVFLTDQEEYMLKREVIVSFQRALLRRKIIELTQEKVGMSVRTRPPTSGLSEVFGL